MNEAINNLRKYFKSEEWSKACMDDAQPVISDDGIKWNESKTVGLSTKINLALDFEGYFNEMASKYMKYRKEQGLSHED